MYEHFRQVSVRTVEPLEEGGLGLLPPAPASHSPLLNDLKIFTSVARIWLFTVLWRVSYDQTAILKRKRELAADLQAGITESEAVAKYRTSKGTVGRVRREVYRYLNLDVDALGEDRKRELKVRTDGLDA